MAKNKKPTVAKKDYDKLNKINNYKNIIIILLIIIIIILLLHGCEETGHKQLFKNNYDVYEIDCECDKPIDEDKSKDIEEPKKDNSKKDEEKKGSSGKSEIANDSPEKSETNKDNNQDNKEGTTTEENENTTTDDKEFIVFDNDQVWSNTSKLHIFENPEFDMEEIIAPGSTNSYKFYIRNKKKCNMAYKISFEEVNPYHINMKYKLKYEGNYIIDHWVDYTELETEIKRLNSNEEREYILEWLWDHQDDVDTIAGNSMDANYKLNITIYGEQID